MSNPAAPALESALTDRFYFGQILVRKINGAFVLLHRDDEFREELQVFRSPEDVLEITRYDDSGNYRPLKTAPNLAHSWSLELARLEELQRALDYFYPGRLAVFLAWKTGQLHTTPLRETLDRQSGMYRVAAKISDDQIDNVVGDFCRSDGGCLRTILWKRDQLSTVPSAKLPLEKFDPAHDQIRALDRPGSSAFAEATADKTTPATAATLATATIPLLCQEPCNLLVAECRKMVKGKDEP
jgi:DR2241 stabilising domain/4Fe-4S iron-sulfur cluster binding domain